MMLFRQGYRKKLAATRSGLQRLIENRYAALSQELVDTDCTVCRRVIIQQHLLSSHAKVQCQVNVDRLLRLRWLHPLGIRTCGSNRDFHILRGSFSTVAMTHPPCSARVAQGCLYLLFCLFFLPFIGRFSTN
jgi:hypothetical protein